MTSPLACATKSKAVQNYFIFGLASFVSISFSKFKSKWKQIGTFVIGIFLQNLNKNNNETEVAKIIGMFRGLNLFTLSGRETK